VRVKEVPLLGVTIHLLFSVPVLRREPVDPGDVPGCRTGPGLAEKKEFRHTDPGSHRFTNNNGKQGKNHARK
jgi:hypothetical protein